MIKRDFTNQYGYVCPTENEAIRNADRKPDPPRKPSPGVMHEEEIKAMDRHRKAQSLAAFMAEPAKAETDEYKQGLKRARAMKATIEAMASIAGYECRVTLKDKSTGKVYEHDEL